MSCNIGTKNIFDEKYNNTIGFEFFSFHIKINGKVIKLQIWDTCGQEVYRSLITNFYRNSSLAIIVYSVTDKKSFDDIDIWLKELRNNSSPDVKKFLIGNKIDLEDQRKIKKEEGESFAKQANFNKFIETSAKTGVNAKELFIEASKMLYDDFILYNKDYNNDFNTQDKSKKSTTLKNKKVDFRKKKIHKNNGCCSN